MSSQMRDTLIESYAEKVIAHAAENGGRCRLGFVKELVGTKTSRELCFRDIFDGWTGFWKWKWSPRRRGSR
jgi:hypothetical protein